MSVLCECGCGGLAVKRFISGHNGRVRPKDSTPLWKRVLMKCDRVGDCLVYRGYKAKGGYGMIVESQRRHYVHRVVYEFFFGSIPDGHEVDHVYARGCRYSACCRPDHLEAVTASENCIRREQVKRMRTAA